VKEPGQTESRHWLGGRRIGGRMGSPIDALAWTDPRVDQLWLGRHSSQGAGVSNGIARCRRPDCGRGIDRL